jgi:hypothetical protein
MNYCYLLYIPGTNRTYIGATNDPAHRLKQHNGELTGGAKATKGHQWTQAFYVSGFPDWSNTLQFEWAWKRQSRNQPGLKGKIVGLRKLLALDRATTTATPYAFWSKPPTFHITTQQRTVLQKIEPANFLLEPQHIPIMAYSPESIEVLKNQIADMSSELSILQRRLTDALAKMSKEPKVPRGKIPSPGQEAPKRQPTPYLLFCAAERAKVPIDGKKLTLRELGERWKGLSPMEQAAFNAPPA